jgi:SPX domain protein involved in polyphosphate accumulation
MYKVPDDARLEIKFASYTAKLDRVLNWIKLHPAAFYEPHPDRWVNNVYFDTHNNAAYVQNLSGASSRVKVRYRWYGQEQQPGPGALEVKCKRNFFGWKKRFDCRDLPVGQHDDDWRDIDRRLSEALPHEARLWLQTYPMPTILNRYYRRYFVSSDERIRVTVDTDQAVWDQRYKAIPNYDQAARMPDTLVLEVKFARDDRDLASDVIQTLPIRVSRHSKFMNGVRAISFD